MALDRIKRKKRLEFLSVFACWCRQRDLNSHSLRPLPPQDSVSTNFTMSAFEKLLFLLLRNRGRRFGIVYGFGCLLSLLYVAEVQTVFCCVGVNIHHSHAGCKEKCCCNGGRAAEEVGVAGRAEYALRAAASRSEGRAGIRAFAVLEQY